MKYLIPILNLHTFIACYIVVAPSYLADFNL